MHIVGTARSTVVPVRYMTSSAALASKRPITTTQAPARMAGFMIPDCPRMWENGAAPSMTSSAVSRRSGPATNSAFDAESVVRELCALRVARRPDV